MTAGKEVAVILLGIDAVEFAGLGGGILPRRETRLVILVLKQVGIRANKLSHYRHRRIAARLAQIKVVVLASVVMVERARAEVEPFGQTVLLDFRTGGDVLYDHNLGTLYYLFFGHQTYGAVEYLAEEVDIDITELRECAPGTALVAVTDIGKPLLLEILTPYELGTVDDCLARQCDMLELKRGSESYGKRCILLKLISVIGCRPFVPCTLVETYAVVAGMARKPHAHALGLDIEETARLGVFLTHDKVFGILGRCAGKLRIALDHGHRIDGSRPVVGTAILVGQLEELVPMGHSLQP